jgi:hypothetical protein
MLESLFIDGTDWFFKVTIDFWVFQVNVFRLKISQYPWKNGVLGEVAKRPVTRLVQVHQIVVVCDLFGLPH